MAKGSREARRVKSVEVRMVGVEVWKGEERE